MAISIQNVQTLSRHMPGWPVLPLKSKSKSSSLPTKTNTQRTPLYDIILALRSLTCPKPSSAHKNAPTSQSLLPLIIPLSATSLDTRHTLVYGVDLDHSLSTVSPLDVDEPAANGIVAYSEHTGAEDLLLSDLEADDSSDSGSELSFCPTDSSGRCSPSDGVEPEPFSLDDGRVDHDGQMSPLLPSLLLMRVHGGASASAVPPETSRPHAASFSDLFFRAVPDELKGVLGEAFATHDPYTHTFDVTLGKRTEAGTTPIVQMDPYERAWYARDQIYSLSVTVMEDVNEVAEVRHFLLWVLEWAQKYNSTLEDVRISVPDYFPLLGDDFNCGSGSCLSFPDAGNGMEVLPNLRTLTWAGDAPVLQAVLARFIPHTLHILKIERATLSIGDALLLVSHMANFEIYALELGTLSSCAPSLRCSDDLSLPLHLPYLDSLKVASSIPLERFFSALSLPPSLCKLEFDLTSAATSAQVVESLIASEGLLNEYILFMDIEVDKAFGKMKDAMRKIKEKAGFAYVAFRGQVAEGE